jgi:uncharacterized protein
MRVTCDANFLVRAALHAHGLAAVIVGLAVRRPHVLVLSPELLADVGRVLRYPHIQKRYSLPDAQIDNYLRQLQSVSDLVRAPIVVPVVTADPDDDIVIATAVDGQADVIGTKDQHFRDAVVLAYCAAHSIRVLTDVELVQELRGGAP